MNTLAIVLIAAVCLAAAYLLYGRWLANKWGIDPAAKTPSQAHEDGQDYVPTKGFTVFCHQFSSIAGAGPVTGAIQAAAFGWLPVLLWVLLGGIFFGAVTDFGALYASVKNDGKSIGLLIEKYIGKLGRKLFLLFCWLFTLLVIAAFADMVAGTFNAFTTVDGQVQLSEAARPNGAAGTISLLFILFAMVFGVLQKKFNLSGWKATVVGLVCTVAALAIGMALPITAGKDTWTYITFVYIFFAAVLPIWLLKQPRDMMTTYMFIGMIVGAVLGLLVAHPTMNLPVYTGFTNEKLGNMFPILFVTVACGAISGFHSTQSPLMARCMKSEKQGHFVFYGAMVCEGVIALIWAAAGCALYNITDGKMTGLAEVLKGGQSAAIYDVCKNTMGGIGIALAMIGVVICPITSGDTAFRSARLTLADWLHIDQDSWVNRLKLCIPVLGVGSFLGIGNALKLIDYTVIWRYFSWTNQTLAMIVLWAASMYLFKEKKNYWITAVPATFMSAVSCTYFVLAPECLGGMLNSKTAEGATIYNTAVAYPVGIIFAIAMLAIFIHATKKAAQKA